MSADKPVTTQARTPSRSRDCLANLALAADQSVMSEDCPDNETFARFIERGLSSDEQQTVFEHISNCDGCYRKWLSVSEVLDTEQENHRQPRYRKRGLMTAAGSVCAAAVGVMLYLSIDYQPMVQTDRADSVYSEKASVPPVREQEAEPEGSGAAPEQKRTRLATSTADTKVDFEALDSEVVPDPAANSLRKKQRAPEERAEAPQTNNAMMVPESGVVAGAPGEKGTERDVTASPEPSLSAPQLLSEQGGTAHYIEEFISLCGDYPENRVKQSTVDTLIERGQALLRADTVQGDERAVITEITEILEKGVVRDSGAFFDTCRRAFEFGTHRGYDLEQLNFNWTMHMNEVIDIRERIIVALDVDNREKAQAMVRRCESHIGFFKVGLQLFMADYFNTVDWILDRGHKVMLDLKFYDIPETVKLAVEQLNNRGISLATIHGNDPIIRAAVEARGDMKLLAVTVLTSIGEAEMRAEGMTRPLADLVRYRAGRALDLGCDGVVSSGLEAKRLRDELGDQLLIVTPGIRPGTGGDDDQKRIMTAGAAVSGGANHVVVGRPITRADDPIPVIEAMQEDILGAL